jgi:parallel beta-helix repeat protein
MEEIEIGGNANLVKGNTVFEGLSGIKVEGSSNVIEENLVTYCGIGIYFSDAQNVYANNRALNNLINYGGSVPSGSGDGGGNVEYILSEVNNNAELRRNVEKDRQKRSRTQ